MRRPASRLVGGLAEAEHRRRTALSGQELPLTPIDGVAATGPSADARKWLSCRSGVGAEAVATLHGLIATCWLHDVDSYDDVGDVRQLIHHHPAAQVHLLTPRL